MSKVLAGFLVLLGMAFYFSSRDSARFQALSLAEQYEERCRYGAMASTMAAEFIRLHLNIVESPKFERLSGDWRGLIFLRFFSVGFALVAHPFSGWSAPKRRIAHPFAASCAAIKLAQCGE